MTISKYELEMLPEARIDKVKLAIERMEQRINSFYGPLANALAGKKLTVKAHPTTSSTDGKRVYLAVPLVLGEDTEHIKALCGKRDDETKWMECPASAVTDELDSNVYHEVLGHILFDSFVEVGPSVKRKAFEFTLMKKVEEADPERVEEVWAKINAHASSAMQVASMVDCWLPMVTNMIEDIFVNQSMYAERPGTWESMYATDYVFLTRGPQNVGHASETKKLNAWADAVADGRAIMCLYVMANKFDFARPLVGDDMSVVLDDPRIQEAVAMPNVIAKVKTEERLELALEVLGYLREHGFCIDPRSFAFKPEPIVIEMTREEYDSLDKSDDEPDDDDPEVIIKITDDPPPPPEEDGDDGDSDGDDDEDDSDGGEGSSSESSDSDDDSDPEESDESESGDGEGEPTDDDIDEDSRGEGESSDADTDDGDDSEVGDSTSSSSDDGDDDESEDMDHDAEADDPSGEFDADSDDSSSHKTKKELIDEAKAEAEKAAMEAAEKAHEAKSILDDFIGHPEGDEFKPSSHEDEVDEKVCELILDQRDFFDTLSFGVTNVAQGRNDDLTSVKLDSAPPYQAIMPSLGPLRIAFTLNKKRGIERNRESGPKLDSRHLYRIKTGDPRWHAKRTIPKARDWSVLIGCDNSGSTSGRRIQTIVQGAYAMGSLLDGVGIPFSMYGHSGRGSTLLIDEVKTFAEPWAGDSQKRCLAMRNKSANLDGHTLEYYRRILERQRSTDKLLLYITDGAMPCENYDEELEILQKNIRYCMAHGIYLVGIGVQNDDPKEYGLDMIRYDKLEDLPFLVNELAKRLEM